MSLAIYLLCGFDLFLHLLCICLEWKIVSQHVQKKKLFQEEFRFPLSIESVRLFVSMVRLAIQSHYMMLADDNFRCLNR